MKLLTLPLIAFLTVSLSACKDKEPDPIKQTSVPSKWKKDVKHG